MQAESPKEHITVKNLTMAYGDYVLQSNLNFSVNRSDIFIIMGGSGCGKSTLLKYMIGLRTPEQGKIYYNGIDFYKSSPEEQESIMKSFGILYQSSALWSSMTLSENIALPLEEYTQLTKKEINEIVSLKLALVGLKGFGEYYPSELSGGMKKRAGLARAMALDPQILFFDEPSAGLDPVSSRLLDELILQIRDSLGTTIVVVTHELPSIFTIGTNSVFLDAATKTMIAHGNPKKLLEESTNLTVRSFLTRAESMTISEVVCEELQ